MTAMLKSFRHAGNAGKLLPKAQQRHKKSDEENIWAPAAEYLDPRPKSVSLSPVQGYISLGNFSD